MTVRNNENIPSIEAFLFVLPVVVADLKSPRVKRKSFTTRCGVLTLLITVSTRVSISLTDSPPGQLRT